MSRIEIRQITSESDRQQAFNLRYRIYVEERQVSQTYADHSRRIIEEPLDPAPGERPVEEGVILGAFAGERLIGTARYNFCDHPGIGPYADWYRLKDFGLTPQHRATFVTKLCVEPEYRGSRAMLMLSVGLFEHNLQNGVKISFLDCNPPLEPLFQKLGYRQPFENFHHPEYGSVHPMVLVMNDLEHFRSIRSPFKNCAAHIPAGCLSTIHFRRIIALQQLNTKYKQAA